MCRIYRDRDSGEGIKPFEGFRCNGMCAGKAMPILMKVWMRVWS